MRQKPAKPDVDPKTGMLRKLLTPTSDPRCNCPRACGFHGTCYSPHEKPGSRAAQRRLRQLEKQRSRVVTGTLPGDGQ